MFNLFMPLENDTLKIFGVEEDAKAGINLVVLKFAKLWR